MDSILDMAIIGNAAMVTPAPVLSHQELKRDVVYSTAWTPVVENGLTNYNLFTCGEGLSISISSTVWRCCAPEATSCAMPTACHLDTFYYPQITATCINSNLGCGVNLLALSEGAAESYTQFSCATAGIAGSTYFIESPGNSAQATIAAGNGENTAGSGATPTAAGINPTPTAAGNGPTPVTTVKLGTSAPSKAPIGSMAAGFLFLGLLALVPLL